MASYQDSATSTATGANGVTYSYRRMGTSNGAHPLVLLQHFRGNLDNWDPALFDALAAELNRAVGGSDAVRPSHYCDQRGEDYRKSRGHSTSESHRAVARNYNPIDDSRSAKRTGLLP